MRQFFLSIPSELEEAARVDGANTLCIFWSVALPLARPALTAVAIITFLSTWNSLFWPLIVTRSDSVRTLPVGIAQFLSLRPGMVQGQMSIGQSMAGAVFAALPPIIVFVILQRYFIAGISRTGLKG
jgi:ABC-type glycerol-3-phosphate transport system permease component